MNILKAFKYYQKINKVQKYLKNNDKPKEVKKALDNIKADVEVLCSLCPDIKDDIKGILDD